MLFHDDTMVYGAEIDPVRPQAEPLNGPISSPLLAARAAAMALLCAGLAMSCALADGTVVVGEPEPDAVEVNLSALDGLTPSESNPYASIDAPAIPADGGSVLLIEPSGGYVPSIAAPEPAPDTFTLPPPLPEPAPQRVVVETSVEENAGMAAEEVVAAEVVAEEVVAEETMTETMAVEEPPETVIEASDSTGNAAMDLLPEGNDEAFDEIQQMLGSAEQAPAIEVPEPEATVEETVVANAVDTEPAAVESVQIVFSPGVETLSERDKTTLDVLVTDLSATPDQRIQLMAYASAQDGTASMARRMALSRALEVRKYLIDSGVRSTRIDVRALGDTAEDGPLDRIDIVLVGQ